MKNRSFILLVIFALVLAVVDIYIVNEVGNKLETVIKRLDSVEAGFRLVQSNNNRVNIIQNEGNKEKIKEVLTPSELANYLRIDMGKVYDMIDHPDAKLPYVNINGEYRFSKNAIDEWLKSNSNINTAD
jgi:excisionase family DNA binding protein